MSGAGGAATCPAGHRSATEDYCDVCGAPMPGATLAFARAPEPEERSPPVPQVCPSCGAPASGRYCEDCGHDFERGRPGPAASAPVRAPAEGEPAAPAPGVPDLSAGAPETWVALVSADRDHHRRVVAAGGPDAEAVEFPAYCPDRSFALETATVRIGRRSASRGITPEIDLSGPPLDPGVSHLHALLVRQADGGWHLVDPGSTNGTTVNEGEEPIAAGAPLPLADGDRVHVGAWTTILVRRAQP